MFELINKVKEINPLVLHYTNEVTINDCANITLALGASPLMSYSDEEVEEIVSVASSVVINIGTMNSSRLELFVKAMLFQGLFIVATCSVVFLISTLIKSSMVTMALSVVVTVFLTIASQLMVTIKDFAHLIFVNYADGISILTGSSALTFNNPNMTVQNGIIIMIATSVISYIIAHINFTRKDILI